MSLSRCFRSFALDVVTTWTFGHCAESLPTFHSDLFEILDVAAESVIYFQHIPFLRALIPYIAPLVPSLVPNKILGQVGYPAQDSHSRLTLSLNTTVVAPSAFYGCYNETVFPNPECYDPTRWLPPKHSSKMEAHLQPFSRGTRQCIGQ
ncbi:Cytochrome P450 6a2, partial [Colletotrichum shisoi]